MAALLASTPASYVDPRASILYGGGNSKITDDQIRAYIKTPGVTDKDIMAKALANNVSAAQVSRAMMDNHDFAQPNIDKYLSDQGVSKEQTAPQYSVPEAAAAPAPVRFNPITVGTTETVQGQLASILNNKNSPLMVQASTAGKQYANKRGMLDSSIGAGAAESAMIAAATPIAQQDASTHFSAKSQNAQGALTADTFNADTQSRTNMFNTGAAKDIYTANMDTNNKLAIANIQAMANDSGIMGDLGKTYMGLYAQVAADQNMTPEVKTATLNNLQAQLQGLTGLLPSINSSAKALTFGKVTNATGDVASGITAGASGTTTVDSSKYAGPSGKTTVDSSKYAGSAANKLGYQVEPATLASVIAYEKATGDKVDRARIAPEALVMDIMTLGQVQGVYISKDGVTKITNSRSYDIPELLKQYGAANIGGLFNKMFVAAQPPGTKRADNPMFYVYR